MSSLALPPGSMGERRWAQVRAREHMEARGGGEGEKDEGTGWRWHG